MEPPTSSGKYPHNQEHIEARQEHVNQQREAFVQSLPELYQKKFAAVEQAIKILIDNNVIFYLFPFLPISSDLDKFNFWEWSSLRECFQYDDKGVLSSDSKNFVMGADLTLQDVITQRFMNSFGLSTFEEYDEFVRQASNFNYERLGGDKDENDGDGGEV